MATRSTTPFDRILARGIREKKIPALTKESRNWYRDKAKKAKRYRSDYINMAESWRKKRGIQIGSMYFFHYKAKHAKKLPYWDEFPAVMFFNYSGGLLYGINFHYLGLKERALLMDSLYALRNNDKFDESTKLRMSWSILNRISKSKYIKPAVKSYLPEQVRSEFMYVHPTEWDILIFLPLANWKKASAQKVYADSRKKIRQG